MADVTDLLRAARAQGDKSRESRRAVALERSRLWALREQDGELSRRFDPRNGAHGRQREQLRADIAESAARVEELKRAALAVGREWTRLRGELEPLLDPRRAVAGLDANYPILLFPVRLETRFVTRTDGPAASRQLLVRVYPDECLVDSFDPDLSESEVKNLRRYWATIWSAGGDEPRERAAWRELCAAHGAGRALYLTAHYTPLSDSDPRPTRVNADEIILAIPADAPLVSAAERLALSTYWIATWRAGSNAAAVAAARQALETAVTAARADVLLASYVPMNAKETPTAGVNRATVAVSTVFVRLTPIADAAAKRQAWTKPPIAALLPERFVLVADSGSEHIEAVGGLITQPLAVGPDPLADESEQFKDDDGDLEIPEPLRWMSDFEAALAAGMAFRLDLTPRQAESGFDRLYVLGLRLAATPDESRADLEALLQHHANGASGFAILRQGTPTNNSDEGAAGWTRQQEADEVFAFSRGAAVAQFDAAATAPYEKADGLHLAEALGIDAAPLQTVPNADGWDQAQARAMNAALWPATFGYWMDTQLRPIFDPATIARTRAHFVDRVRGRGSVPTVRIGRQPYGILPTTAFSRMNWMDAAVRPELARPSGRSFLIVLRDVLRALGTRYWHPLAAAAPHVGRRSERPQQQLLDIVGLHPSSVEFHLQILDSAERIWNEYKLSSKARVALESAMRAKMQQTAQILKDLGHSGTEPEIVAKFFSHVQGPMNRPAVDHLPLSETAALGPCTTDNKNYITWCREKAARAFEDLRLERGFADGKTPNALLYHMLQHGLQLGYYTTAADLHLDQNLITLERAYREPAFVHVADTRASESRYALLYAPQPAITGVPLQTVAEFIPQWLTTAGRSGVLAAQIEALAVLEAAPTAALERAFAEHIDLCSYRWDGWILSLVNERLHHMRRPAGDAGPRRQGVHLGAFGWVENLRPEANERDPVTLDAAEAEVFDGPGQPPLVRDSANAGHMLAPSLNHAATAAVLRNGYVANATPTQSNLLAVDLSSARVRVALQFMEGIRNGQSLGALLGYQLERRLHDRHNEAETDRLIYQIRKAFPLAAKHLRETTDADAETAAIEAIEARNVCDGVLLLEHVRTNPVKTYPWGKPLAPALPPQQAIIDQEVGELFAIQDAIADVVIAEAMHQVMVGNPERAAAAMDATSKGAFPPEPDVVRTPRSGTSLTHRVALHLPVDAVAAAGATPRAQVEPALDAWLATVFPPLTNIVVRVEIDGAAPATLTMEELGLGPIDLLYVLNFSDEQAMGELDDRILHRVLVSRALAPDARLQIRYAAPGGAQPSAFEVAPLASSLRSLLLSARPLRPSDAAMPNEAETAADQVLTVPQAQVNAARGSITQLRTDVLAAVTALQGVAPPATPFTAVVAAVDGLCSVCVTLQQRANLCGLSATGAGSVLRARKDWFALVRDSAAKVADRWAERLLAADALLAAAVNPANSDLMKLDALERAEREISTSYADPIPATPAAYFAVVLPKRAAFAAALTAVQAVSTSNAIDILPLWNAWAATFAGRPAIDLTAADTAVEEARVRALIASLVALMTSVVAELDQRLAKADALLADATTAGGERKVELLTEAVKALLGDGVRVVPRFTLAAGQGDEWQNAFDQRAALLAHLQPARDFPVDDWLYGIARVRGKLHDWETLVQLTSAFSTAEPSLVPVQFPFRAGEPWLGLELPPAFDVTKAGDHILYTAAYAAGPFEKTAALFGGLLLDEWTEVIPGLQETAGLAFHYDRPSHEPPQTMLLVTPATASPQWSWEDVSLSIPETFALARTRAVEPRDLGATPLSRLLPATLMAFTTAEISISSKLRVADVLRAKNMVLNG